MQKNKGITLVSLVITITVLLIVASIATYSGLNVISSSKLTAFTAELKVMQTQVNSIYEEDSQKQIGEEITGDIQTQANLVFTEAESGITSYEGYRYWSNDEVKKIGIEGVEQSFFVNLQTRSIVSYQGLKYQGKNYYTLNQVPDGLYNVGYENPNQGKPTFQISQEKLSDDKFKIIISNIQYEEGYIDKWQVQYQLEGKENWSTSKDLSFIVNKPGRYHVVLVNGEVKSDKQIVTIDSTWEEETNTNAPKLMDGMTAVYWDESNNEMTLTSTSPTEEWDNWYEYVEGDNATDTKKSRWANAKITKDGVDSYFVWIPRYEYKILSGEGTNAVGKITVKLIPKTQTEPDAGYKIHPAFKNGTNNNFKNGEWDSELAGIWVAKYETCHSDATKSAQGSSNTIKIVPNVQSWRNITIGESYTTAYNYDRDKESHLMKNSEWGAVAYFAHSQYGRNGHEIDINISSSCITGIGNANSNTYDTSIGAQASTTGNIYGIYDLSGGALEWVASYISNGSASLSNYGSSFATTTIEPEGYKDLSTKYATVYPYDSSNNTHSNNYNAYKNANYGHGDAILETSDSGGGGNRSWFNDTSRFFYTTGVFIRRGGSYSSGDNARPICL